MSLVGKVPPSSRANAVQFHPGLLAILDPCWTGVRQMQEVPYQSFGSGMKPIGSAVGVAAVDRRLNSFLHRFRRPPLNQPNVRYCR
jgi:hypothetical protein